MIPPVRIKANFNREDIAKYVEQQKERFHQALVERLTFIGLNFVRKARLSGNYTDRTGNLRSSIGFLVVYNGQVVGENFEQAGSGTEGQKGMQQSKDFANELAGNYPRGYALIVVAGMEYAAAVESKDYDVLTGASATMEEDLKRAIAEISNN